MGLRPETGPEMPPLSMWEGRVPAPGLYGWEEAFIPSYVIPCTSRFLEFLSSLRSPKETESERKDNFYSSLDWGLTWVPRRPCRAPRRRRTCPESCPRRDERQVGPNCPRAAITPSSRRVVAPRTSCALVCSWERDGREKRIASKGMQIAGGEPVGVASRMNHKS